MAHAGLVGQASDWSGFPAEMIDMHLVYGVWCECAIRLCRVFCFLSADSVAPGGAASGRFSHWVRSYPRASPSPLYVTPAPATEGHVDCVG